MPGTRYNFRIIKGPFKGERARFIRSSAIMQGHADLHLREKDFADRNLMVTLPLAWLQKIKQPTTSKGELAKRNTKR